MHAEIIGILAVLIGCYNIREDASEWIETPLTLRVKGSNSAGQVAVIGDCNEISNPKEFMTPFVETCEFYDAKTIVYDDYEGYVTMARSFEHMSRKCKTNTCMCYKWINVDGNDTFNICDIIKVPLRFTYVELRYDATNGPHTIKKFSMAHVLKINFQLKKNYTILYNSLHPEQWKNFTLDYPPFNWMLGSLDSEANHQVID
ncbi:MAG: hypothetical protein Hyperionvirus6_71 [Hyperionvirus sp.]|uniref:Uncharacterized protein n=1 Tax=Hyperionvirus sp. TaxID=2487770 RepID=A0A3G5A7Y1_9VIRU|nr:MAG: hypothetical protein Hyperionvirus6_71 [Hyperionvirus sp.]